MASTRLEQARERARERQETVLRVKNVLIQQLMLDFEHDEFDDDTPLFAAGLGLDSVDALEVVFSIENEFRVRMDDSDMLALRTVNTVADLVEERTGA